MLHNKILGKLGEQYAEKHLKKSGYQIIAMNYANKIGEIDIIARCGECIIFIEVKTRETEEFGRPAETVNLAKQQKIVTVATMFMAQFEGLNARFDVVEIIGKLSRGKLEVSELNHIENAFY